MSNELKTNKSSFYEEKENQDDKHEIDVILDLYTKVIKKGEKNKCICANTITESMTQELEIVPNISINLIEGKIRAADLLMKLKECGYPLHGAAMSVYNREAEDFVFLGTDPIDQSLLLDENY